MRRGFLKDDTNLRDGPGLSYTKRGLVGKNRRVDVLDANSHRDWIKVRVVDGDHGGKVGWMYASNLHIDA